MNYRYGTITREVIRLSKFEVCGLMDGIETNPFGKMPINLMNASIPGVFHPCPFEVNNYCIFQRRNRHLLFCRIQNKVDFRNLTIDDTKWASVFPSGLYKYDFLLFEPQIQLLSINFTMEVKSEIKTSF